MPNRRCQRRHRGNRIPKRALTTIDHGRHKAVVARGDGRVVGQEGHDPICLGREVVVMRRVLMGKFLGVLGRYRACQGEPPGFLDLLGYRSM